MTVNLKEPGMTRLHFDAYTGKFTTGRGKSVANPELARERGRNMAALNKALKLAKANGIDVDKDSAGGWWVTCSKFTQENDPLDGSHFCAVGQEVLETVQTYIDELTKLVD